MAGAPRASEECALEIEQIIARGVTAMVVGSSALLGRFEGVVIPSDSRECNLVLKILSAERCFDQQLSEADIHDAKRIARSASLRTSACRVPSA
jgi:hypothetical protein